MRLAVFDVGGTAIKYAAMTDGEMDGKGEVPTPATCSGDFLAAIEGVLDALHAEGDIEGVALSLPGVIDAERGLVVTSGALPCNDGARASAWEERWGVPVRIDNDARCATMAELSCGNLVGVETRAVLAFGTGVGGGIVVGAASTPDATSMRGSSA